jgi:hypothetical protein
MGRTEMTFVPTIPDIDPDKLIRMNAGNGDFYVCNAGVRPDGTIAIFYGDESHQFLAFCDYKENRDGSTVIEVSYAANRRIGGQPVRFSAPDLRIIEENLTFVLMTRNMIFLNKEILPIDVPSKINFTWRVAQ